MELRLNLGFEQVFSLANQLSRSEKEKLITALSNSMNKPKNHKPERQFGKYLGQIKMADDFDAPLDDFKKYM